MAQIEFYIGDSPRHISVLDDGAVPRTGEYINIEKTTYEVLSVTWAVDQGRRRGSSLRANVVLSKPDPTQNEEPDQ